MRSSSLLALAASLSTSAAVLQGFNYGSTQTDGSIKVQADFQSEFATAKALVGTSGFTSARLYTMLQGTGTGVTEAVPAAIAEGTSLLLGVWASGGQAGVDSEIAALKAAITQYGEAFTKLVIGLSVGSEDLYRISPTGIAADSGLGADPDTLVSYIGQVRDAIAGTGLSSVPIGHVDTWTAWVNGSNSAVVSAVDWLGMDAYPYFQNTEVNDITVGSQLFQDAYSATESYAQGKPVWITETGWPVSGSTSGKAVPSLANAKTYWDEVGCGFAFGKINTFWFTLQDADPTTPNPSFGLVGATLSDTPLYDLSCSAVTSSSSTTTAKATTDATTSSTSVASTTEVPASTTSTTPTTSATTAETTSASVVVSETSIPATSIATSGGGLSPSGPANGVGASGSGTSVSFVTSTTLLSAPSSSGSAIGGNGTAVIVGTSTAGTTTTGTTISPTSTTSPIPSANMATSMSYSVVGALVAVMALMATL
jgi:glucan endo-1,3-beta-D-glucosidase